MTAVNRFYNLDSERQPLAPLEKRYEWSFDSMRSFKDKQQRWNCVDRHVDGPEQQG